MNLEPTLAQLRAKAPGMRPRIAVVLGSGWDAFSGQLHDTVRIPYADLAGFPMAGVAGHRGELLLAQFAGHAVAVLSGRQHAYETGAVDAMALPLRALHAMGCDTLVQTNAAGSLDPAMRPGSLMLVSDITNHPGLFVRRPDWAVMYDMDAEMARLSRRRVLDQLASDKMQVAFYHAPFPATGHIWRDGDGFRLQPIQWS